MDPTITVALVDYIHLLHKGNQDKSLFSYFEGELKNCSAQEVNIAIENLIIRYKNVEDIKDTVARFIRAATLGLKSRKLPEYPSNSIFYILNEENRAIESRLDNLKKTYLEILPYLEENRTEPVNLFRTELEQIELIKKHYLKLQNGVFSALEAEGAPSRCVLLMWHLEDSIWPKLKTCLDLLSRNDRDCNRFNKIYGQMFFLLGSLVFREDRILYPLAYDFLSGKTQRRLMDDAYLYGLLS